MNHSEIVARFEYAKVLDSNVLEYLQTSSYRPFSDSKSIVDLQLTSEPSEIVTAFTNLNDLSSESAYRSFLFTYFCRDQGELAIKRTNPEDCTEEVPLFTASVNFNNSHLTAFVLCLKQRWGDLCREFRPREDLKAPLNRTSLIPLPHPFFVPGGRFQECYYWDSLWVVKGLTACDMLLSAQNAVRNLLHLVQRFGFVPNGNRVYYLNRTQPPVLTEAVRVIYEALESKEDKIKWLQEATPTLDKELTFFHNHRSISKIHPKSPYGKYSLSLYSASTEQPRPESFLEDVSTAKLNQHRDASVVYHNLSAGAESGWDFSSRWFENPSDNLSSICIADIVPVDLNSWLLHSERTVCQFWTELANHCSDNDSNRNYDCNHCSERASYYNQFSAERSKGMMDLLWSRKTGAWYDFNVCTGSKSSVLSAAFIMPVWAQCLSDDWSLDDTNRFVTFLTESQLIGAGGITCSLTPSGEQWDYPNCWAPLVDLCVDSLLKLSKKYPESRSSDVAKEIAVRFLRNVFSGWKQNGGALHEKYNFNSSVGERGQGGEYIPQVSLNFRHGVHLRCT